MYKGNAGQKFRLCIARNNSISGLVYMAVTNDLICFAHTAKSDIEYYNSSYLSNKILYFDHIQTNIALT